MRFNRHWPGRVTGLLGLLALVLTSSCAKHTTAPGSTGKPPPYLDMGGTWRPDGRALVVKRSHSGVGTELLLVSLPSLRTTHIADALWLDVQKMSWASDGNTLAFNGLTLVDVRTGERTRPLYSHNGVVYPDWHPTLSRIVYARNALYFGDDPDSAALHVFDVVTGTDSSLKAGPLPLYGSNPRWSPDGKLVAYVEAVRTIRVVDVERHTVENVYTCPDTTFLHAMRWAPAMSRPYRLYFSLESRLSERPWSGFEVNGVPGAWQPAQPFARALQEGDEISPDGHYVLVRHNEPGWIAGQLYIEPLLDVRAPGLLITR